MAASCDVALAVGEHSLSSLDTLAQAVLELGVVFSLFDVASDLWGSMPQGYLLVCWLASVD